MTVLLLVCLVQIQTHLVTANFLREGFSSKAGADARSQIKLDEAGAEIGMGRDMFLMKDVKWQLQPVDYSPIKNWALRRHCEKFLNKPLMMRLSSRPGKYGFRAMGETPSGTRLRGFWRQVGVGLSGVSKGSDFLQLKYDDAVKQRLTMIEFEIQLPPIEKKAKVLPSVIYSVAVEPGTLNLRAIVPRGAGSVRILPEGHVEGEAVPTIDVGKGIVSLPMRSGIVDPSWAKGRIVFRKGRPAGYV